MVQVTTAGLRADGTLASSLPDVAWAVAAGTVNAITAVYDEPNTGLTDGLILGFRASGANTITNPTFAPDGLTARTITRYGGQVLLPGDIPGATAEVLVRYNLASTRWELLNPARVLDQKTVIPWAVAGGSENAITATYTPAVIALTDGMILAFRASGANTIAAPTFSPNGLTAHAIVHKGGEALNVGDIHGADAECLIRYNEASTRWELLNPSDNHGAYQVVMSDLTGANNTSAQSWFPGATGSVALQQDQAYSFEGFLHMTRAAGTTSHQIAILFGGSATVADLVWFAMAKEGDANDLQDMSGIFTDGAGPTNVKAASTSATENFMAWVRGHLRCTGAGTFTPQFSYSTAPGGAPTIREGTFFTIKPVGPYSTSLISYGPWS